MLYFITPYSFEEKLFEIIDQTMNLVADNDWICFTDGDTAFLRNDFGHRIMEYIQKFPDTGLFTCYASRCHYSFQVPKATEMNNSSILYHKRMANEIHNKLHLKVKEIDRRIAGHLMLIKKSTWILIRKEVAKKAVDKNILGVDTKISNAIINNNLKIRLMRGIYIFHYCRLAEGFDYTGHLK